MIEEDHRDPCVPSPCGPNAICRVHGSTPSCSCIQHYIGRPPNCRPECTINAECEGRYACQNEHCIDPCPGSCGAHTTCVVINHSPACSCLPGFIGDPFIACSPHQESKISFQEVISNLFFYFLLSFSCIDR